MKLRITIKGPKVHNIGYRFFLMSLAHSHQIRRFEADNINEEDGQAVKVLVEGDADKVEAFKEAVKVKRPERAEIEGISFEEYQGDVLPMVEYTKFYTCVQWNQVLSILEKCRDNLRDNSPE